MTATTKCPLTSAEIRKWLAARGYLPIEDHNEFGHKLPSNMGGAMLMLADLMDERDQLRRELEEAEAAIKKLYAVAEFFKIDDDRDRQRFFDSDDERGEPGHWKVDVDPATHGGYHCAWAGDEMSEIAKLPAIHRAHERAHNNHKEPNDI